MPHKTVFVVGPPRTGTSIIVKCLEKSGLNIGKNLFGHKYKSQDVIFRKHNRNIKQLLYEQLAREKPDLKKPIEIGKPIQDEVNKVWRYVLLWHIEVLKDPLFYEIFGVYWHVSKHFREQKFIWTHRDPLETAKSAVRLKYLSNVPGAEPYTSYKTLGRLKKIDTYNLIHEQYFPKSDSINVYFEDLLHDTQGVSEKVTNWLGREFDVSLVSRNDTFAEKGEPQ